MYFIVFPEDYTFTSPPEVTFGVGDTPSVANGDTRCLTITINNDDIYEEEQDFTISISGVTPSTAVNFATNTLTKTIQDDGGLGCQH